MMLWERFRASIGLSFETVDKAGESFEIEGLPSDFLCKTFITEIVMLQ